MRRIMYIENKSEGGHLKGIDGNGRIGWVELSKSKRSYYYQGRTLKKVGDGYKYNCVDEASDENYWVSGPKKDGTDKLYGGMVEIDEDAREEYWTKIRKLPGSVQLKKYRS